MTRARVAHTRPDDAPITLERIEKCLDRLAVIMMQDREHAPRMLPIFRRLEREADALRRSHDDLADVFERARRSLDQKAEQSY